MRSPERSSRDIVVGKRPRSLWAWVRLTGALLVGALLLGVALDFVTASPSLCASCHEMTPRTDSWKQSAHSAVACVNCHQPPSAWYELPQRLIDRGQLLGRDAVRHIAGGYQDPVEGPVAGAVPVTDDICLQCHDSNRKATSGFRILIDHAEHAERNGSCASCHVRTGHPVQTRGKALSLMTQCFTCHGSAETPDALGDCGLCHPSGYQLTPASHDAATWIKGHGAVSDSDPGQCQLCHVGNSCNDCHGLEMPHPAGWAGASDGHVVAAEESRAVCARCHGSGPDLCTVCHHQEYEPVKGTWVQQHPLDVEQRGTTSCMGCHGRDFCVRCHTR